MRQSKRAVQKKLTIVAKAKAKAKAKTPTPSALGQRHVSSQHLPPLDSLVTFLAVAELRGFRAAAGRIGVTPSAVSQAIRTLEGHVGAPLFARTTRSVGLTEAGERLLEHARPAVAMVNAGLDAAAGLGGAPRGRLRINAPRAVLGILVDRLLPDFHVHYPAIELELVGDDRNVDIVKEGFDAGIRLGHLVEADMIAIRLTAAERFVVVGSPAFLAKHGRPKRVEDLARFPCVRYRRVPDPPEPWRLAVDGRPVTVAVGGPFVANDIETCLRAALGGVGLLCLARLLVRDALARGELEAVLAGHALDVPGLSLYYPSRSRAVPKLRAFATFAKQRLSAPVAPLS
jgi:DNA-binding transcriptional LysR family regulator